MGTVYQAEKKLGDKMKAHKVALAIAVFLYASLLFVGDTSAPSSGIVRHYLLNKSGGGNITAGSIGTTPTMTLDFSQDPSGATITAGGSGAFVLTKASDPVRVNDITWPDGPTTTSGYGHLLDGNDYYTCADATCATNPSGSFTVIAVVTPMSVTGTQYIAAKWIASDTHRGWAMYLNGAASVTTITDNGAASGQSTASKSNSVAIGRMSIIIGVYTYVGDGTSTIETYVDNLTVSQTTSAHGPAYDNADAFSIASNATGGSAFTGIINHLEYIPGKAFTSTEVTAWSKAWNGMISNSGNVMSSTCATCPGLMVAPASSGVEPFLIRMSANKSMVGSMAANQSGINGCPATSNIAQRSAICETAAAGHPSGYTIVETAGDGSSAVDCAYSYSGDSIVNGSSSLKIVLTGTTSTATITSACLTTGIGADLYVENFVKSSAPNVQLDILEWDTEACGSALATDNLYNDVPSSSWSIVPDSTTSAGLLAAATWNAGTSSYQLQWTIAAPAGTVYIDVPTAVASSVSTLAHGCSCTSDADATAVCNAMYVSIADNPITGGGTWEVSFDFFGNWPGNDGIRHDFFFSGATAANDILLGKSNGDNLICNFYDGGGTLRQATEAVTATDWAAATKHSVKCTRYVQGNISGGLNGVAFGSQYTGGAALQSTIDTTITLGSSSGPLRGNLSNIVIRRRATQ